MSKDARLVIPQNYQPHGGIPTQARNANASTPLPRVPTPFSPCQFPATPPERHHAILHYPPPSTDLAVFPLTCDAPPRDAMRRHPTPEYGHTPHFLRYSGHRYKKSPPSHHRNERSTSFPLLSRRRKCYIRRANPGYAAGVGKETAEAQPPPLFCQSKWSGRPTPHVNCTRLPYSQGQ